MSTAISNHKDLIGLIVDAKESGRNYEAINDLIVFATIVHSHPAAPRMQDTFIQLERPISVLDGVETVRGQFEEMAGAFRRAHAALAIGTDDPHTFDFTWRLGDQIRVDWTVPREMLGPEAFLCATCDGKQRVGRPGESEHCPDCDHGYYELADLANPAEVVS